MDDMEKRTLLAIILSVLIIIVFQYISAKRAPIKTEGGKVEPREKGVADIGEVKTRRAVKPPDLASEGRGIVVETQLYRAVLNEADGSLIAIELINYRDRVGKDGKPIDILKQNGKRGVIHADILDRELVSSNAVFRSDIKEAVIKSGKGNVVLKWKNPKGGYIIKTYTFYADRYIIDVEIEIGNIGTPPYGMRFSCNLPAGVKKHEDIYLSRGVWFNGKEFEKKESEKWDEAGSLKRDVFWAGMDSKYFLIALIMEKGGRAVFSRKDERAIVELSDVIKEDRRLKITIFAGPKQIEILKGMGIGLERTIEFGYFGFLARPFLYVLKFFYRITGNYGYAIALLTMIIKIIFFPLSIYQFRSMKEIQKLQPKITALREKYKNEPEKLNKEIMQLYRIHKVNPFGGCLPIIVQIPVFFALYKVLLIAIELRHAPFIMWIKDLSDYDHYYITPVLMGVTMFIQQWITPSGGDPTQEKMLLFLPIFFTIISIYFPSGLVLYWLINNILSIIQQIFINRMLKEVKA